MADCCYKLMSVMKNSWLILLNIPTDQDNAMENAIRALFPQIFHRFCRWHMLKKYKDQLNQMYNQHPKLKDKLISMINHSLNQEQFEAEWATMCDEFGLHDRVAMQALYNDWRMWIAAYFKEVFCGIIQSTQRSESVNSMVKGGYLDNLKLMHEFAKCFLDALVHIHDNEAREKYYS
jgi:transposase-like protein